MIDNKKIGERMAVLRKERGMTGEKFAELLDVSPQAVSKWETGKNLPETVLLPDISRILGVSIDSILIPETYPVKLYLGGHYIDGLPLLRYGQLCDCTWAGSIKLLLDAIGVKVSYSEIMGFSGACYFFAMKSNWCPSAAMLQIAYNPNITLEKSVGVEHALFAPENRDSKVKEAISHGKPVMLIQPRVEMEWGVLCGYTEDGRIYGRSYFDNLKPDKKDIFTNNEYFLADSYPGADPSLIYFLDNRATPIPLNEALKKSLETALWLYTTGNKHNNPDYALGLSAYDVIIDGLRRDDTGFAALTQYGATGNGIFLLTQLIDKRRAANAFWIEKSQYLSDINAKKMRDVANLYADVLSTLNVILPNDIINSTQNGYPFEAWSVEKRNQIADTLITCKEMEQQVVDIISDVLNHW